jgi:hypothetical protein
VVHGLGKKDRRVARSAFSAEGQGRVANLSRETVSAALLEIERVNVVDGRQLGLAPI